MFMTNAKSLSLPIGIALLLAVAGCQSNNNNSHGEQFAPEDGPHASTRLEMTQAAAGARADATLHECHFDGPCLNSLGEQKLNLMLQADGACSPLAVYLAVSPEQMSERRAAVTRYLQDAGLQPNQIKLAAGPNPGAGAPAAPALQNLDKTDTGVSSSPASSATNAPGPGGSMNGATPQQ